MSEMEQAIGDGTITPDLSHTTFVVAMKKYFGLKPGQALSEFAQELKSLTEADRHEFATMLRTVGYDATRVV